MIFMSQVDFVAHALRDYLRPHVTATDLSMIDVPLECGEPYESIAASLCVALNTPLALPPECAANVLALEGLTVEERELFSSITSQLPAWIIAA